MDESDQVFSEDMIGCRIVGCISHPSAQFLLPDDGRTIEISEEYLGDNEGYWVLLGRGSRPNGKTLYARNEWRSLSVTRQSNEFL